jgi:hypothetical protein
MNKPTWMQGLLEAEKLHKGYGFCIKDLYNYLNQESNLVSDDYKWNEWLNGFHDYICHLNNCKKKGVES